MKIRATFVLAIALAAGIPAYAQNPSLPSEGLDQRIDFWKKIYTQYGADDVVVHDRVYVNLIYSVTDPSNRSAKIADAQDALREIRLNLETPENLSTEAKTVLDLIVAQKIPLTAGTLDDLSANIHTQIGIKERFQDGVVRSGRYVEQFRKIMASQGVPTELALLPLVESSFVNARSSAGAVGVWQFTAGTGRSYMRINSKVDERLDPVKSSEAAARLLRDNYSALGEWPLAITAYNHGRGGMLQAQKLHGSDLPTIIDEYRGPVFGYASMNFYSEFLAAVEVYENYPQYFGELVLDRPNSIPQDRPQMAAAATTVKPKVTPRISPAKTATPAVATTKYKVQSGDTLFDIAQRFGTSIRDLMDKNNLSKTAIYAGQILLVK
jgi:membrane-bound lytic murein transglycosylase D